MRDIMEENTSVESDIKKLREEVCELRKMVNLLIGLMMEDNEEEFVEEDSDRPDNISSLYN